MTKTILFAFALTLFAVTSFGISSAYACGGKPCAKCDQAEREFQANKKPCEKTLGKKKPCVKCLESESKKPCAKCLESEKKFQANKKPCSKCPKGKTTSYVDHSNKGSLTVDSKYGKTRGTASYND